MRGQKGKVREQGIKEGKERKNLLGVQAKRQAIKRGEIQTCLRFLQYSKQEDDVLNIYKIVKERDLCAKDFIPSKECPSKTKQS